MDRLRVHILAMAVALIGVGCTPQAPQGFRDTTQPIGATTRFDALRFAGDWVVIASFTAHREAPVKIAIAPEVSHLRVTSDEVPEIAGLYREGVPGELLPITGASEPLIVMWVDDDFRTAAVGTASGSFGAVLNRDQQIPQDRARAAREILSFYGWDVSRLKRTIR